MEIKKFKDLTNKELNFIINSHYNHWVKYNPKMNKDNTIYKFTELYTKDELPFGIALFDKDTMVGFCVLKYENLKDYPEIHPWISDLLIFEEYRNNGYGKYLLNYSLNTFKNLGYKRVFLWTDQVPEYYKKLGYTYYMKVKKNKSETGDLFYKDLL